MNDPFRISNGVSAAVPPAPGFVRRLSGSETRQECMACGAPAAVELLYGPGEAGSSERLQLGSAVNVAGRALLCSVESAEQLRKRLEDQREALAKRSRPGSSPEPRAHNVSTQDEGAQRNGPSAETVEGEDPLVQRVVGQVECNATQEHRPHGQQLAPALSLPLEADTPSEAGAASEVSSEDDIAELFAPQLQATPARAAKRKHSASPAPLPWRAPSRQRVAPSLAERLHDIQDELHEVKEGRRTSEANFIVKKALRAVLDVLPDEAWARPLVDRSARSLGAQSFVNPGGAVEQVKQTGDLENSELRDLQELLRLHGFNEPRDAAPFLESIESKLRADAFKRGWLTREPDYVHTKRFIWREQLIAGFPDWAGAAESALALLEALDVDGSLSENGKLGFSLAEKHCRLGRKSWAERFARVWRRIRWTWDHIPCSACRPGIGPRSREWAARIERARDECDIEALKRGILWVLDEALRPGARVRKRIPSEMEGRKPKVKPSELKRLQKWTQAEEQEWRRNLRECRGPIRLGNLVWQLDTKHMDYQEYASSDDDDDDDAPRRVSFWLAPTRPGSEASPERNTDRSGPGGPSSGAAARMESEGVVDDRSERAGGGGTGVDVPRVKTEPQDALGVSGAPGGQAPLGQEHVGALGGRCGAASSATPPRGAVAGLLAARGLLKRGSVAPAGQEASGRGDEGPSEVEQSGRADAAALGAPKMRARKSTLGPRDELPREKIAKARKSAAAWSDVKLERLRKKIEALEKRVPNARKKKRLRPRVVELWPPGHASDGEPCMSPQDNWSADAPDTESDDDSAHIVMSDEDPCDVPIFRLGAEVRKRAVPSATYTWQANITCTALPKDVGYEYYIPFNVYLEDVQSDADDERESGDDRRGGGGVGGPGPSNGGAPGSRKPRGGRGGGRGGSGHFPGRSAPRTRPASGAGASKGNGGVRRRVCGAATVAEVEPSVVASSEKRAGAAPRRRVRKSLQRPQPGRDARELGAQPLGMWHAGGCGNALPPLAGPGVDAVGGVATAVAAPAAAVNVLPFQPGKLAALPASVSANTVHSDDTVMQCAAEDEVGSAETLATRTTSAPPPAAPAAHYSAAGAAAAEKLASVCARTMKTTQEGTRHATTSPGAGGQSGTGAAAGGGDGGSAARAPANGSSGGAPGGQGAGGSAQPRGGGARAGNVGEAPASEQEERGNPYWVNENMAVVCISSSSEDEAAGTARRRGEGPAGGGQPSRRQVPPVVVVTLSDTDEEMEGASDAPATRGGGTAPRPADAEVGAAPATMAAREAPAAADEGVSGQGAANAPPRLRMLPFIRQVPSLVAKTARTPLPPTRRKVAKNVGLEAGLASLGNPIEVDDRDSDDDGNSHRGEQGPAIGGAGGGGGNARTPDTASDREQQLAKKTACGTVDVRKGASRNSPAERDGHDDSRAVLPDCVATERAAAGGSSGDDELGEDGGTGYGATRTPRRRMFAAKTARTPAAEPAPGSPRRYPLVTKAARGPPAVAARQGPAAEKDAPVRGAARSPQRYMLATKAARTPPAGPVAEDDGARSPRRYMLATKAARTPPAGPVAEDDGANTSGDGSGHQRRVTDQRDWLPMRIPAPGGMRFATKAPRPAAQAADPAGGSSSDEDNSGGDSGAEAQADDARLTARRMLPVEDDEDGSNADGSPKRPPSPGARVLPAPPPPVDLCEEIDVSSSEEGDDELYDRKVKLSVDVEREDGSQPLCTECARVQPTLMRADGTHLCVACAPRWLRSTAAETAQSCCVCRHARVSPSWIKQPVGSGLVCMHCACMTSALLRRRECACGATSDAAEDGRAHVALTDDGEAGQWVCDSCVDAVPRPPGPGCLECGRTSSKGWVPDPLRVLRGQPWGPDRLCMECLPEAVQSAVCCYRTLLSQRLSDAKKPMSLALTARYRFMAANREEAAAQLGSEGPGGGNITRVLHQMWNKLSESERQEWIARARKDRERQVELRESSPGSGSGSHGSGPSDVAQGAAKKLPLNHAGDAAVACPGCGERAASTLATRTKHLKPLCEACVRAWVEVVCGGLVCSQCSARVDWDKVNKENKEAINPGDGRVVCIGCAPGTGRAKRQCRLQQPSGLQQPAARHRARGNDGLPGCICDKIRGEDTGVGKAGEAFRLWKLDNPDTWLAQHADCLWEAMLLTDCMPPTRLQVERIPGKGWGLVAREAIPKNSFVMDFGGILMAEDKVLEHDAQVSYRRSVHSNNFEIWSRDVSKKLILVPTRYGNAARMMNHACADGTIDSGYQNPCPRAIEKLQRLAKELGIDSENKRADPNKIPEGGIVPPYTYLSAADHIDRLRRLGTGSVLPDLDKLREDGRATGCRAALRKINWEAKPVFFTVTDVPEGAELVYNYNMKLDDGRSQHDVGKKRCKCGAPGCKVWVL
ncbi:unnamed protein product [Pedinophyceae sp. YPF-701]|nr:unnamed protein product [Pedinophyceae sp. YPF-701]